MTFVEVTRSDDSIRMLAKLYWNQRLARLLSFLALLVTGVPPHNKIENATGFRSGFGELFSGCYLDRRAGQPSGREFGRAVECDPIVEVCNLAAAEFGHSRPFIENLIGFAESVGAERAVLSPPGRLKVLFNLTAS